MQYIYVAIYLYMYISCTVDSDDDPSGGARGLAILTHTTLDV